MPGWKPEPLHFLLGLCPFARVPHRNLDPCLLGASKGCCKAKGGWGTQGAGLLCALLGASLSTPLGAQNSLNPVLQSLMKALLHGVIDKIIGHRFTQPSASVPSLEVRGCGSKVQPSGLGVGSPGNLFLILR